MIPDGDVIENIVQSMKGLKEAEEELMRVRQFDATVVRFLSQLQEIQRYGHREVCKWDNGVPKSQCDGATRIRQGSEWKHQRINKEKS